MLKKWQREEITKTLTALSQLVEEPLEYDYYITNDKSKVSYVSLSNIELEEGDK